MIRPDFGLMQRRPPLTRRAIPFGLAGGPGDGGRLSRPRLSAHPHVFVSARAEIVYRAKRGGDGAEACLELRRGLFRLYHARARQERRRQADARRIGDLAKVNMESLPEVGFFTTAKANGKAQEFGTPTEASLSFENKILTLTYTLPLKTPAVANRSLRHRDRRSHLFRRLRHRRCRPTR
jgi:hypothetical protein